ncbi:MAG: sulfotransferase [Luteimonas sp.]
MQTDFETLWRRARSLENEGNPAAAKAIYESLLQADPERLYVRLRLSAIEQVEGNYRAAREHALRSGETVRHARWKDLAVVTTRLLTFDEHSTVRGLILGTDWNDPEILKSSAVLAQHLWLIDETAQALRMIENASLRAPSSPILSYSRAQVLRYLGRMEEATVEYERCLQLEPNEVLAHWSLAHHEKSNPPRLRIGRIKRTQAALPADAVEQPYLHYALFKEFDNAGDVDQAWASLQSGARTKRRSIRYDAALEEQGFEAMRQLTNRGFVGSGGGDASSERVPIFILGMPRSGTTLLERVFGNHSQVVAAGELNDFNSALCWESNRFLESFITPRAVASLRDIDYAHVGANYLERTREKARGSRYLVDKNPVNFIYAGLIGKALPQARIVCLRRGAMDSCMSNLKELFASDVYGYSYDLTELADYYIRFERMCDHWRQVLPDQFHTVDYESLVTSPLGSTEQVMKFCGVPFEPDCVDITRNEAPVSTASSSQVRQPINTKGIGAWRKYAKYLEPLESRIREALPSLR